MTLPTDPALRWPPIDSDTLEEWQVDSAWYSGDPRQLAETYGGVYTLPRGVRPRARRSWTGFWSRRSPEGEDFGRLKLHVPLAGDLASASADLLFSEFPDFEDADDATLEAIDLLREETGLHSALLEAAELCAALGGVYLVPRWDVVVSERAFLAAVHPDAAVPTFRHGRLTSVVFHRVVKVEGSEVWRHLESHDVLAGQAVISHALYRGTADEIGNVESDAALLEATGLEPTVETPIEALDVSYVPNIRPNRRWRGSDHGRSDFQGIEGILDGLDQTYTSWMRDVVLGQARIPVPASWLEPSGGRGQGTVFDVDREVFVSVNMSPLERDVSNPTMFQPDIRSDKLAATCLNLIERAVSGAGYSPQSFGLEIEGRAESGTALNIRERKTFITREKKRGYWAAPLADTIERLLIIDNRVLGNGGPEQRPRVGWRETLGNDPLQLAQTLEMLHRAEAVSTEERVRRLNPDWSEDEVNAEVQRLADEKGMTVPNPLEAGALT